MVLCHPLLDDMTESFPILKKFVRLPRKKQEIGFIILFCVYLCLKYNTLINKFMRNERTEWPAENGLTYEAPRVEVFEVNVERGFEGSLVDTRSNGYPDWEDEVEL
jgi:hypothetical protein